MEKRKKVGEEDKNNKYVKMTPILIARNFFNFGRGNVIIKESTSFPHVALPGV